MKIDTLKDLEKIIKLCRKTGVSAMRIDGVEFELGPEQANINIQKPSKRFVEELQPQMPVFTPGGITAETKIPTDGLTDEQLLMWSAQGHEQQEEM